MSTIQTDLSYIARAKALVNFGEYIASVSPSSREVVSSTIAILREVLDCLATHGKSGFAFGSLSHLHLVNNNIIDPRAYLQPLIDRYEWWSLRGVNIDRSYAPKVGPLYELLSEMAATQRRSAKNAICWRVAQEAQRSLDEGWYMVFDTLTFADITEANEGVTEGWKQYVKKVRRKVGAAVHGSVREAEKHPAHTYARYVCVVEGGGTSATRIHLHAIWWFKDIPDDWKRDPNAGRRVPDYQLITNMISVWQFGWQAPIAVRQGPDDAWARLGWRWPVDRKTGVERVVSPAAALGSYLSKYLMKEDKVKWRTRITSQVGKGALLKALAKLPTKHLRPLMAPHMISLRTSDGVPLPSRLVRTLARQERLSRISGSAHRLSTVRRQMKLKKSHALSESLRTFSTLALRHGLDYAVQWLSREWIAAAASSNRWDPVHDRFGSSLDINPSHLTLRPVT